MYKLFYSPGACSMAVHIVLEELGVPYELVKISVRKGETASAEYREVNPKGRVPALQVGDNVLTEGPAISMFLAAQHPEPSLLPSDPMERFRCMEWFGWLGTEVHSVAYGQYWRPQRFIDDPRRHEEVSAKGKANIIDAYNRIEQLLAGQSFAVGERYTCVDPLLLVFYVWGNLVGLTMTRDFPAWSAHTDRVVQRQAVQRVLRREGLPSWLCVRPVSSALSSLVGKLTV